MQKKAKKSENYLHLCKIFRNFVAENPVGSRIK